MPEENQNTPPPPPTPNPDLDIVEGLFADDPSDNTPPPPPPSQNIPPAGDEGKDEKIDVEGIVNRAVTQAVERIKPLINQSANNVTKQAQLDTFFRSEDGQDFLKYKDAITKAATDPTSKVFGMPISQIPAAILKPEVYGNILVERKTRADNAAKDSRTGGTSPRSQITPQDGDKQTDYSQKAMSREEFLKVVEQNKRQMKAI